MGGSVRWQNFTLRSTTMPRYDHRPRLSVTRLCLAVHLPFPISISGIHPDAANEKRESDLLICSKVGWAADQIWITQHTPSISVFIAKPHAYPLTRRMLLCGVHVGFDGRTATACTTGSCQNNFFWGGNSTSETNTVQVSTSVSTSVFTSETNKVQISNWYRRSVLRNLDVILT